MDLPRTPSLATRWQACALSRAGRAASAWALPWRWRKPAHGCNSRCPARRGRRQTVAALIAAGHRASGSALDVTDHRGRPRSSSSAAQAPFDILVNSAGGAQARVVPRHHRGRLSRRSSTSISEPAAVCQPGGGGAAGCSRQVRLDHPHLLADGTCGRPDRSGLCRQQVRGGRTDAGRWPSTSPSHNIRVNTICPTFIETELSAKNLSDPDFRAGCLRQDQAGPAGATRGYYGPGGVSWPPMQPR